MILPSWAALPASALGMPSRMGSAFDDPHSGHFDDSAFVSFISVPSHYMIGAPCAALQPENSPTPRQSNPHARSRAVNPAFVSVAVMRWTIGDRQDDSLTTACNARPTDREPVSMSDSRDGRPRRTRGRQKESYGCSLRNS